MLEAKLALEARDILFLFFGGERSEMCQNIELVLATTQQVYIISKQLPSFFGCTLQW